MNSRFACCVCVVSLSLVPIIGCYPALNRTKKPNPSASEIVKATDVPAEFTVTPSGLKYKVLRPSDGKKPKAGDTVKVHYKGWLDNGKVFDSSYDRGEAAAFGVEQVIPGWTEGLKLMGEGGMMEFEIPSELAYGSRGAGRDVPPNSTLHFQVELLKVD
jgi:FKBP-type peptidyl-prolyl cis-trans isomerase FkpA